MNQLKLILRSMIQLTVLLVSLQWFCGCSLVFLGIGAVMDGNTADTDTLVVDDIRNLKSGDEIRISRASALVLDGTYLGSSLLDSSGYMIEGSLSQPFRNDTLTMKVNADTVKVLVDDINCVERRNSRNAAAIGFGIGLAVDAAFAISTAVAMKDFKVSSW